MTWATKSISKDSIVEWVRSFYQEKNRLPKYKEINELAPFSKTTVRRLAGSLTDIANILGIDALYLQNLDENGEPLSGKASINATAKRYRLRNLEKCKAKSREYYSNMPTNIRMWRSAKRRAKKRGLPFTITKQDIMIPAKCTILGIALYCGKGKGSKSGNSPSLDRINPLKGYTKDNIQVISDRANTIKSDATPEELLKLALYMCEKVGINVLVK